MSNPLTHTSQGLEKRNILMLTKVALLGPHILRKSRSSAVCLDGLSLWPQCRPSLRTTGSEAAYACVTRRSAGVWGSHILLPTNYRNWVPGAWFIRVSSNSVTDSRPLLVSALFRWWLLLCPNCADPDEGLESSFLNLHKQVQFIRLKDIY